MRKERVDEAGDHPILPSMQPSRLRDSSIITAR
jgi:hypothetical protein